MVTCVRRLEFDYGHRLLRHESKCAHVHGHRGALELEVRGELDRVGRVIDFGEVKRIVGGWLDENWDHAFLVNVEDSEMVHFLTGQAQRRFLFPAEPSAENMAAFMLSKSRELLVGRGLEVVRVRFWETPNGSAVAE